MVVSESSVVEDVVFDVDEDTSASIGVIDGDVLSKDLLKGAAEEAVAMSVEYGYTEAVDFDIPVCDEVGVSVDVVSGSIDALDTVELLDDVGVSDEVSVLVRVGILDNVAVLNSVDDSDHIDALDEVDVSEGEVIILVIVTVLEVFDDSNGVNVAVTLDGVVVAVVAFHQIVVVVVQQPSQSSAAVMDALALTEVL
ncbi:hypothetical protein N7513_010175 [Penicillium frequentans]|nr:hypothetical protein N7513_010175 [Penicillium glabrum]